MDDLIEALTILRRYESPEYPTYCVKDTLYVCVSPAGVSVEDISRLCEIGFYPDNEDDCFYSYRFGSA